jgi:hypothetical protein
MDAKIRHLGFEGIGVEATPLEPSSKVPQRRLTDIETGYLVTSGRQLGN